MIVFGAAALAAATGGCAKNSAQITAAYVSPYQFEQFTCPQIAEEAQRVSHRAGIAAGAQDERASRDAVATGVGVIIFWPALLMISGDGNNAAELARLRGELEALEQVAIRKRCGIRFERPQPPAQQAPMRESS
jgi:hypothetical protein